MEHNHAYRNIRARILYLLHPGSQFLGDNCVDEGYVFVWRIIRTRRLRQFPYEQLIDVLDRLVHEEGLLEYDQTRLLVRYARNSPLIVAAAVLDN